MKFEEALRDLEARQPEVMPEPSLDCITRVATLLDDPQRTFPTVHITGTNGKTTTARLVTALACAHGLTTGTFISPHVESVTERLSVCGEDIPEGEFAQEYERLLPYLRHVEPFGRPTYFEALTALAFLWFADKPVGLGVFEVGMGGTWDATNLVTGQVAVLCPIGLDHVQVLGGTVAQIAEEKAGIIKPGRAAVVREQRTEAMEVISRRADAVGARLLVEGADFALAERAQAVGGQSIAVRGAERSYDGLLLPLFGEAAARNAAAAVTACETLLGRPLDEPTVREALAAVRSPGRLEVVSRHPLVVLDGAHNPDATAALRATLTEAFRWERLHLVIAMFEDKDVESAVAPLATLADAGYAAANSGKRSAAPERVAAALRAGGLAAVDSFPSVGEAVGAARAAAGEGDLVLVTGSFYTVGDARTVISPH